LTIIKAALPLRRKEGRGKARECKMNAIILRQETQLAITIGKIKAIYL
jgi:hypothetical protein